MRADWYEMVKKGRWYLIVKRSRLSLDFYEMLYTVNEGKYAPVRFSRKGEAYLYLESINGRVRTGRKER